MSTPQRKPAGKGQKLAMKILLGILAAMILFAVLVIAIGTTASNDEDTTAEGTTEQQTAAPETATNGESDANAPAADAPNPWDRHPACEPDNGTAAMITGVLNDETLQIQNGQLIKAGNDTWIGASLVRPDGEFESRSDVWLLRDGKLYSVSNGAQNNSWAVTPPGVSMADEYASGVDRCVVAETMGR